MSSGTPAGNSTPDPWRPLVIDIVADVLAREAEHVRDVESLFDLPGFDSVAVVAVLERLEEAGGVEVPPDRILPEAFESVDSLCALLAGAQDAGGPRATPTGGTS